MMHNAFAFAEKHGICAEGGLPVHRNAWHATYRHVAQCVFPHGSVVGFKAVATNSEQALLPAVRQQPVSRAMEGDQVPFPSYKTGVLTDQVEGREFGVYLFVKGGRLAPVLAPEAVSKNRGVQVAADAQEISVEKKGGVEGFGRWHARIRCSR